MDKEQYLENRLEHQINWYDKKSQKCQNWFKALRVTEIVCAAIIPFLAGMSETVCVQVIIGTLGVIIAICAGLSALNKYQENWFTYRATCETLRHEKFLFLTEIKPYDTEEAFSNLVERVESLISKENTQWSRNTGEKSHNK